MKLDGLFQMDYESPCVGPAADTLNPDEPVLGFHIKSTLRILLLADLLYELLDPHLDLRIFHGNPLDVQQQHQEIIQGC